VPIEEKETIEKGSPLPEAPNVLRQLESVNFRIRLPDLDFNLDSFVPRKGKYKYWEITYPIPIFNPLKAVRKVKIKLI